MFKKSSIKSYIITGLLIWVPLVITLWVLNLIVSTMDQTLQLEFQDFAGGVSNLSQILNLRPGRYRLSGEVRFEGFASPTGSMARVRSCTYILFQLATTSASSS